ncbi:hypothetical protein pEaSNUABM29_00034 [Erwinia phage pEa_SNUABM_29]|nr:hypothetical protein pEaSNUABM29_00034 [Erwinia phage pEa_SNUABM_29]
MIELFYWAVMVISGSTALYRSIEAVKELKAGDWYGVLFEIVVMYICWKIHVWALTALIPGQTLFS